jgi:RHS repeat-associated protein
MTSTVEFEFRDRLGSLLAYGTGDDFGSLTVQQTRAYDAFGKVRQGNLTDKTNGTLGLAPATTRGFTNQEHQDDAQVIHMNGRIYDYQLGRFLGVDPIIGNPTSSQALNPYSYIGNNPLSGVDPTGYTGVCDGSLDTCGPLEANAANTFSANTNYTRADNGAPKQTPLTSHILTPQETSSIESKADQYSVPGTSGFYDSHGHPEGLSPTLHVTPDGVFSNSDIAARRRLDDAEDSFHRDSVNLALFPLGAALSVLTGTNVWRHNPPGDDSIESAALPGPVGIVLKGTVAVKLMRSGSKLGEIEGTLHESEEVAKSLGYGVDDPPSRISGPWTQRDLQRAAQGKGPLDLAPATNAAGKQVPIELHHAGQMPGSGIHEAPPHHSRIPGIHPNQRNQGVTPTMRIEDAQLHWQMRGQEMGNPPPPKR